MPGMDHTAGGDFAAFDPEQPAAKIWFMAQRIDALTREKEELEDFKRDAEARLRKIEALFTHGVFGVEAETLKWLARADEPKLKKIDAAIQFMDNAQFMGKWTWIGLGAIGTAVGAVYGLVSWFRNVRL